ncbi:MAG: hypothetical protein J6J17_05245 [Bacilli bacterium]|nr:hypothetical protein [Bacilli bacterium]
MTKIKNEYELFKLMKDNVKYGYVTYDGKKYFSGCINYNEIWFESALDIQRGTH